MPVLLAEFTVSTGFLVVAYIAIGFMALLVYLALFEPGLRYKISSPGKQSLESDGFLRTLEAVTDSKVSHNTELEVLTNGENYFEAELDAIRSARRSITLEAYIFQRGRIVDRFIEALSERARAGVKVNVLLDAVGSAATTEAYMAEFKNAGGKLGFYHPLTWQKLPRYNNRTHREIIIVDGEHGFIGGSGIADHWIYGHNKKPRWRDTMVRVRGDAVTSLQGTFVENWLESCGELLTGDDFFPEVGCKSDKASLVVNSTPSAGGSTRARVLFQVLLASASKTIHITTPYFLPDTSIRGELVRAKKERGVEVVVLVPGKHNDHLLTRSSSRLVYGRLLREGIDIYEYEPAMLHAKILVIDDLWSVVGSTNFDNRSFGLNDEVNLAVRDPDFAARLEQDFARDIAASKRITLEAWRQRSLFERGPELLGWILERQQ